jgi:hypothetical protein
MSTAVKVAGTVAEAVLGFIIALIICAMTGGICGFLVGALIVAMGGSSAESAPTLEIILGGFGAIGTIIALIRLFFFDGFQPM